MGRRRGPIPDADPLMTVAEVANTMRVSNMTVYRLIKSGELPALRVGRGYRIRHSWVERFLEERSVQAETPENG
jgi:excisionase family DNA binding protein